MEKFYLYQRYCPECKYNRNCYLQNNGNNEFVCLLEEKIFTKEFKNMEEINE